MITAYLEEKVFKINEVPITKMSLVGTIETQYQGYVEVVGVKSGTRFGYFVIDRILGYLFALLMWSCIILPDAMFNDSSIINIINDQPWVDKLGTYFLVSFLYYFIFEWTLGTSLGKLMLGYIVVDEFGNRPAVKQILLRSLSRLVPFEPFSCFKWLGWHDSWSDTMVISKKELADLKTLWQSSQL
jgi:uncharacterized RDD family membrane protein YckC